MLVSKEVSKYYNLWVFLVFFFNWVEPTESFQFFCFPSKNIVANTAFYLLSSIFHSTRSQTCSVREGRSFDLRKDRLLLQASG